LYSLLKEKLKSLNLTELYVGLHCNYFRKIDELAGSTLNKIGYSITNVKMLSNDKRKVLQVMAERIDNTPFAIEDCMKVNNAISTLLDVYDVIPSRYVLEISSPGINRHIARVSDFVRFVDKKIKVKFRGEDSGRFNLIGILKNVKDEGIEVLSQEINGRKCSEDHLVKFSNMEFCILFEESL